MVNSMDALFKLWLLKGKGTIRNLFRKPSSAIFTILMILLYGGLFVMMFTIDEEIAIISKRFNTHLCIMIAIGFCALMIFMLMMQKKKALFLETDSFYLFSGPFTKENVMTYLSLQSILQSMLFGLLSLFVMVSYTMGMKLEPLTYLMVFIVCSVLVYFFLLLTDYLYILSITNEKYKRLSFVIALVLIASILAVVVYSIVQSNMKISDGLIHFVLRDVFYFVPVFGWAKLLLIAFIEKEIMKMLIGAILLLLSVSVLCYFFIHFKGDFYEKALEDSIAYTALYKSIKEGKQTSMKEVKIKKDLHATFKEGAWAIYSKNVLLMRKTKDLIGWKDVFVIGLYLAISYFSELGFMFFMYMLMIYIYAAIEESSLMKEFENYQVYLIPDKPFKKLLAIILPNLVRLIAIATIAMIVGGILFGASLMEIILNIISIYGYICVFTSASVLSVRILKSRTNKMMVSIVRMLLLFICVLPAIALSVLLYVLYEDMNMVMYVATYAPLILNIIIALFILFMCRNMLNGRELSDD